MIRRSAIVGALVLLAASCTWPMAGQGPDRRSWSATERAFTTENTGLVQTSWSTTASFAQEVVGDAGHAFARSQDLLRALDPGTGVEQWHVAVAGRSVPGLIGDGVMVAADGARCSLNRLAASDGTPQASATIGYPYGSDATSRSCTAGRSVLTENGRVVVSTASRATFTVPSCGGTANTQLWAAATTVEVLDDTLHPVWTATDATLGCGEAPATSPVASFGEATATASHFVVARGNDVVAYPRACATPCTPAWTRTFGGPVLRAVGLPGARLGVAAAFTPLPVMDDADGHVIWTAATGAGVGFAADDSTIFFADSSNLVAYPIAGCGAATCTPAWTAPLGGRIPLFPPAVTGRVVILPAWETPGLFFDARGCGASTCAALPGQAPGFDTQGAVSVVNGRIYAANATSGILTYVVAPA